MRGDSEYRTAQVCVNGHVITKDLELSPEMSAKFCPKCAEPTVSACECGARIRGRYCVPGVLGFSGDYSPPSYCHECGKPFPWTSRTLDAARELIGEMGDLSEDEKEELSKSLDDLLVDSPKTQVAAIRFRKFAAKAGATMGSALRDIMVDVLSEAAKKTILG